MKTYTVTIVEKSYYDINVEADDIESAERQALQLFYSVDLPPSEIESVILETLEA